MALSPKAQARYDRLGRVNLARRFWRWVRIPVLALLVVFGATLAAVQVASDRVLEAHRDGKGMPEVDAIIVLGSGVDGDGRLAYSSRRRVEAAVRAYLDGRASAIIMTGGMGPWHPGRTGADLMREFAVELGADPADIVLEESSTTTFENLRFSFEIAEERGFERLALASDAYHLTRGRALAAYLGKPDLPLVAAFGLRRESSRDRTWAIIRETLSWWYNLYKVVAWEILTLSGYDEAERGQMVR